MADGNAAPFRVAVATTDGKVVNTHFGHAASFLVFGVWPDGLPDNPLDNSVANTNSGEATSQRLWRALEKRDIDPACAREGGHSDESIAAAIRAIADCQAVLASRIGPGAKQALRAAGIAPLEYGAPIPDALDRLADTIRNTTA